jgi:hypothetical protein
MVIALSTVRFRRDHRYAAGHLSDFLDGGPSGRGRVRIERHVPGCPECERALRTLERLLTRMHELPPIREGDPADIAAAVRRRLREPSAL